MVHKFVYGKNSARMVKKRAGAKRGIGTLFEIALGCGNLRPSCGKLRSSCAKIALVRFCNIRPIVPKSARFRKSARCNKKCIKTCVEYKFVHEWVLQAQFKLPHQVFSEVEGRKNPFSSPKPQRLKAKPQILNPKPPTLSPGPRTLNSKSQAGATGAAFAAIPHGGRPRQTRESRRDACEGEGRERAMSAAHAEKFERRLRA